MKLLSAGKTQFALKIGLNHLLLVPNITSLRAWTWHSQRRENHIHVGAGWLQTWLPQFWKLRSLLEY